MIVSLRFAKNSNPAMGSKFVKSKASALPEAARRRRKRILKPSINADPFLAMAPAKKSIRKVVKKALQRQEQERQREPVPVPVPVPESNVIYVPSPPLVCPCDPKSKHAGAEVPPPAPQGSRPARPVHPPLIDVYGGVAANVILAKRLPEHLLRPELKDTLPEEGTPAGYDKQMILRGLDFVRRELLRNGLNLFNAIAKTVPEPMFASHSSELPEFVTIRSLKSVQPEHMPTHLLMVHSSEKEDKLHRVIAVPIHAPVLAAHCSRVPPLPSPTCAAASASAFDPLGASDDLLIHARKRTVPLVPFSIPSPDTFPLITQFLCTQDAVQLFKALVPVAPPDDPENQVTNLSEYLADAYTSSSLVSNAMRVYGVWQNACSLGVLNPRIWQVIDVAWKGYRDALLLARR